MDYKTERQLRDEILNAWKIADAYKDESKKSMERISALEAENAELRAELEKRDIQQGFPLQPIQYDEDGVVRFRPNKIVRFLLDNGPYDLNDIARQQFPREDEEQFAQLIGYSVSGFGDLSYVSDEAYERAAAIAEAIPKPPEVDK